MSFFIIFMSVISETAEKEMSRGDKVLTGLQLSLIGVLIVFFVLLLLVGFIYGFNWIFSGKRSKKTPLIEKSIEKESFVKSASERELTPELIAVITASVQVAYGPCAKIKTIVPSQNGAYGMQSKINIMSSHVPNKRRGL
ncbi:OadG family protein [bacterium]|nr:OadG family protein [bacterium]